MKHSEKSTDTKKNFILNIEVWLLIAATLILYLVAYSIKINKYGGSPTATVGFGCYSGDACFAYLNQKHLPPKSVVFTKGGYDGQFYYYIASLFYAPASYGTVVVDSVPFRLARIGYPLFAGWGALLSSDALVYTLTFVPLILHLLTISILYGTRFFSKLAILIYAFNPFHLLCFLLNLSDGTALSLFLISVLLFYNYMSGKIKHEEVVLLVSFLLCTLSLFTKESMMILSIALGLTSLFIYKLRINRIFAFCFWTLPALYLSTWWMVTGFSLSGATEHGGCPFAGFLGYLKNSDALFSGRSFLVLLLIGYTLFAFYLLHIIDLIKYMFVKIKNREYPLIATSSPVTTREFTAGATLLSASLFIATATYEEYWTNFANIARFFIPGLFSIMLIASTSNHPIEWLNFKVTSSRKEKIELATRLFAFVYFIITAMLLLAEVKSKPLAWVFYE